MDGGLLDQNLPPFPALLQGWMGYGEGEFISINQDSLPLDGQEGGLAVLTQGVCSSLYSKTSTFWQQVVSLFRFPSHPLPPSAGQALTHSDRCWFLCQGLLLFSFPSLGPEIRKADGGWSPCQKLLPFPTSFLLAMSLRNWIHINSAPRAWQ